jgi:hypothetical protein
MLKDQRAFPHVCAYASVVCPRRCRRSKGCRPWAAPPPRARRACGPARPTPSPSSAPSPPSPTPWRPVVRGFKGWMFETEWRCGLLVRCSTGRMPLPVWARCLIRTQDRIDAVSLGQPWSSKRGVLDGLAGHNCWGILWAVSGLRLTQARLGGYYPLVPALQRAHGRSRDWSNVVWCLCVWLVSR